MLKLLKKRIAFLMTFLLCFSMVDISFVIPVYADETEESQKTVLESTEESSQETADTGMKDTAAETVAETTAENSPVAKITYENVGDVIAETENSPVVKITYENVGDLIAETENEEGSDDSGWETTEEDTSDLEHSYGDYTLTYTLMYGNAILTGYSGTLPEKFEIPETIDGYTITEIDSFAFEFASISSVVIPETITSIGANAFYQCEFLAEVSLPNSISEIEESAFAYSGLTTIALPSSLKQISYCLFEGCSNLVSVQIPDSVTAIGSWAFENCSSLESITISDSVTDFGSGIFNGCISLKTVTIPQLEEISSTMFARCESLETINLGSKITRIGYGAFRGCTSLKSIDLPDSIEEIEDYAFNRCTSLTSVKLPEKLQSVYEGTFKECFSLESVTLGNQVTSIGYKAFANTSSLKSISMPETLTSIGLAAFADSSLSEIGFSGNAPEFEPDYDSDNEVNLPNNAFTNDALVAFYPTEDATWTEDVMQTYGGTSVEWVPWDPETEEILAYIDVVEDSEDGEDEYGIHIIGSGDDLVLECNLPLKYFVSVEIDGVTVDPSNYDLKSGSTIITFDSSFLDTLTPGSHTVTMHYNINGRKVAVKTTIVIKEKPNTSNPSSKPTSPAKPNNSSKPAENNGAGTGNGTSAASQNRVNMKTHLVDANGQPMYNCTLEIHSKPVSATLGTDGTASFKNIEVGNHTMYLKDQDGKVLASKDIKIVYDQTYSITGGDTIHVLKGRPFVLHVKYDGEKLILLSVEGDQTPETGDSSDAMIWILLMAISAAGFVFLYTRKRKQTP